MIGDRAYSRFALSQWETVLLCNDVSHWLGASLESDREDDFTVWTNNGSRETSCYGIINPIKTCVIICNVYSMTIVLYRSFSTTHLQIHICRYQMMNNLIVPSITSHISHNSPHSSIIINTHFVLSNTVTFWDVWVYALAKYTGRWSTRI